MARVLVTLTYEYFITDDLEAREEAYGATDTQDCVEIDMEYIYDIVEIAEIVNTQYEIIEENNNPDG